MAGPCYVKSAQHKYLRVLNSLFTGSLIKVAPYPHSVFWKYFPTIAANRIFLSAVG